MSSPRCLQLLLSCILLVLLVQFPQAQSRPATEDKEDTERSPHRPIRQADQTAVVGGDVTFECKVYSELQPRVQWLKHITVNGSTVRPDGKPYFRILQTAVSSADNVTNVLTLRNVTLNDAGEYTCLAGNSVGISYHSARLTVVDERPPHRPTLQAGLPADQTAVVGGDVIFECKVYSELQARVQWLKHITVNGNTVRPDGLPYPQILQTAVSSADNVTYVLTLRNVTLNDAGEYTCLAGNRMGFSYQTARLTVNDRQVHRSIPQASMMAFQTAVVGGDVAFGCRGFDDIEYNIQWLKRINSNRVRVGSNRNYYFLTVKDEDWSTDEDMHVLILRNVTLDDAGEYTCRVSTEAAIVDYQIKLTVVDEPEPVVD